MDIKPFKHSNTKRTKSAAHIETIYDNHLIVVMAAVNIYQTIKRQNATPIQKNHGTTEYTEGDKRETTAGSTTYRKWYTFDIYSFSFYGHEKCGEGSRTKGEMMVVLYIQVVKGIFAIAKVSVLTVVVEEVPTNFSIRASHRVWITPVLPVIHW